MAKPDKTVLKETGYIAFCTLVMSLIMQVVFALLSKWDYTVALGNLWGAFIGVFNFFVMGLFIQKAVTKEEEEAKKIIRLSHSIRTMFLLISVVIGVVVPFMSTMSVIIPLFFSRIAIALRPLKKDSPKEVSGQNE